MSNITPHYFFRFGSKNVHFDNGYKIVGDKLTNTLGIPENEAYLAIYFANFSSDELQTWKQNKFNDSVLPSNSSLRSLRPIHKGYVRAFASAPVGSIFWVFHEDTLIAFTTLDNEIFDSKKLSETDKNKKVKVPAKARRFSYQCFDRLKVPDLFSTTDSSGFRGTLMKLASDDKKENMIIADALVNGTRINIQSDLELLHFLSPIQLETFFFKLFDSHNSSELFVSAYRGASKAKVDLLVKNLGPKKSVGDFHINQSIELQIKRTFNGKYDEINYFTEKGIYFVTLSSIRKDKIKNSEFLIDKEKIGKLLLDPVSGKALKWAQVILDYECFEKLKKAA